MRHLCLVTSAYGSHPRPPHVKPNSACCYTGQQPDPSTPSKVDGSAYLDLSVPLW
jgi:hypothetical protein